jgi:hypothetical protein
VSHDEFADLGSWDEATAGDLGGASMRELQLPTRSGYERRYSAKPS